MKTGLTVNASSFLKKMKEYPEQIAREQESILKQEARALCIRYAQCTAPAYGLSFDEARAKAMEKRVQSDVRRVYVTRQQGGRVYELIKRRSPLLAKAYWNAWKSKNERVQTRIMRAAGISPEALDPAIHKAARTGGQASVPKNFQPTTLVSETQARAYAKKQAALVGFAQAGWYAAARGLGGRIRRNFVSASGKRSTSEAFPSYIRKLANKHAGIGGARVFTSGAICRVEIYSSVRHARQALPSHLQALAESDAQASLSAALLESVRYLNKKRFNIAA